MIRRTVTLLSAMATALLGCGDDAPGGGGGTDRVGDLSDETTSGGDEAGPCSWAGSDPGDLVSTGNAVGAVVANVGGLVDQCGLTRSLWDFAGGYRIVVLAEGW